MVVINQVCYQFIPTSNYFSLTSGMIHETVTISKFLSNGKYFSNQFAKFLDLTFTNCLLNSQLAGCISRQILSTLVLPQMCFDSIFVLGLDFQFFLCALFLLKKMNDSVFQYLDSSIFSFPENDYISIPRKCHVQSPEKRTL